MTVEQTDVVDVMGIENRSGRVVLTISDHLPWDESHYSLLEAKLRSYVGFIEGGQLLEAYPDALARGVEIRVVYQEKPPPEAERFLAAADTALQERGISLSHGPLPDGF
jgi:hypothetical protein